VRPGTRRRRRCRTHGCSDCPIGGRRSRHRPYGDLVSNVESPSVDGARAAMHDRNLRVSFTWMPVPSVFGWLEHRERQRTILEPAAHLIDSGPTAHSGGGDMSARTGARCTPCPGVRPSPRQGGPGHELRSQIRSGRSAATGTQGKAIRRRVGARLPDISFGAGLRHPLVPGAGPENP
jgi:hypothetical protein